MTLIDAGFPHKEAALFEAICRLGRSPDQLKHVISTHSHPDHIGSAAAIVREAGAQDLISTPSISLSPRVEAFSAFDAGLVCWG